jgi:predicted nucleotidyltransferase
LQYGLTEQDLVALKKIFLETPQIEKVVLFGSRAMGNYKPGSDVDLAISGRDIDFGVVSRLHARLEEQSPMPYFFDVVDLKHLEHPGLAEHIQKQGVVIFER